MLVTTEFQKFPGISEHLKNTEWLNIKGSIFKYLRNKILDLPDQARTLPTKLYIIPFQVFTFPLYKHFQHATRQVNVF